MIQKVYSDRLYSLALKILVLLRNKNTLYDIDDAEYLRHSPGSIHFFMKNCTSVSVGSKALEKYALQFNKKVILTTSPVIEHSWLKASLSDKLTIGWVGDYGNGNRISYEFSHKKGLNEMVFPVLRELTFPFRFILIGISKEQDIRTIKDYFSGMENIELVIPEHIDWTDEDWLYREISNFDIGLAPLIDHEFNKAKSAYKAKQYLSCGVPVLGSSVGENADFILHGINGFICDSPSDYSRQIQYFAGLSRNKYFEMSKSALACSNLFRTRKYCEDLIKSL